MAAGTDVDAQAFRQAQEITWTKDGSCPGCECCDQLVCVAAGLARYTPPPTCAGYIAHGLAPELAGARYGPRCPCTVGVFGPF